MIRPKRLVLIASPQAVHSPAIDCAGQWAKALTARLQMVAFVPAHLVDLLEHAHTSLRDKAGQGLLDSFRLWLSSEAVLVLKLAPIMAHANEAPTVIPARVAQVPS